MLQDMSVSSFKWYQRWWGVVILSLLGLAGAVLLGFGVLTGYYWRQIKSGQGAALQEQFSRGFSLAPGASKSATPGGDEITLLGQNEPRLGQAGAPIIIVEFIDFKCPNCLLAAPILKKLAATYGREAQLIIRDFPVETTHPGATELSILAYCAHRQGRFWPMHDILFREQANLGPAMTAELAEALAVEAQLDTGELKKCRTSPAARQKVDRDYLDGASLGVRGTPTFFVNGRKVEGVVPFEAWKKLLENVK